MYKILNLLFSWDYIAWSNFCDQGIARVRIDKNGVVYFWRYKGTLVTDRITTPENYLWLTCKPEKYIKYSWNVNESDAR